VALEIPGQDLPGDSCKFDGIAHVGFQDKGKDIRTEGKSGKR